MDVQTRGAEDRRAALRDQLDLRRSGVLRGGAVAALSLVLAVILFAPATLGGKVLSASDIPLFKPPFEPQPAGARPENPLQFDAAYVFEPDGLTVRAALREGRLPVWSGERGPGWPLLATQQSAPLFPLTWIGVVFPYWESLAWIAVIKLCLAALGTFLFARALSLRTAPALLAAVAFGFGTYLIVWLMHPHANAYVLLPWLLLVADRLCRSGAVRDAAGLAGLLGLAYLSGQPESGMIVGLATAAWVAYRLASARPARREAVRVAALAALAALIGAAIGAVMILPLVEALNESFVTSRSGPPLPPKVGLSLAFPEYWGRPDGPALTPHEPSNFTERTLYAGALPAVLAFAGMFAARPRGPQLFFAGLTLASLAVALDTGPVSAVARNLPILDQVALHRVLVLAAFGIAMLAAFGLQHLLDGTGRRRMLVAAGAAALLPPLIVVGAHPSWLGDTPDAAARLLGSDAALGPDVTALASALRWSVLAVVTMGLLLALVRWPRHKGALAGVAIVVAAVDLLAMGWGYNPAISKAQADPVTPPAVEAMRRVTRDGGRVVSVDGLIPNSASRWGLRDARGHEQPVIERTTRLWLQLGGTTGDGTVAVAPDDPKTPMLLDTFGVRAVLFDRSRLNGSGKLSARGFADDRVVDVGRGGTVVEHRSPLPDAFVAYRWRTSRNLDESLLHMALSTAEQTRDDPVIETADAGPQTAAPPATAARIVSRSDTEVRLELTARSRGQLVLLDSFYPGWRAEVDGRETPVRPANAAFRAVAVDPGRHEVRFSYRPASVISGGAISLAAIALTAVGLLLGRRRRGGDAAQGPRNPSMRSSS